MTNKHSIPESSTDRFKEISSWASSAHDLDQHLEIIMGTISQMMRARVVCLMLMDHRTNRLKLKTVIGEFNSDHKNREIEVGKGIAGYVAEKGEPLAVPVVGEDLRCDKESDEFTGFKVVTTACVPVRVENETIGTIEVMNKVDGSLFQEDDLKMLSIHAEAAALALDKARKEGRFDFDAEEDDGFRKELCSKYGIIGKSESLQKVVAEAFKVAKSKASTLILGESGTGKELLARLIHQAGPRRDHPMIGLNCAALTETLMEDELFGHEKGAYTGALSRKIGKFELADQGTLFLDEIGEMSPGMQAKMLRVLQEGVFYRVGGNLSVSVDVRIICATNRDIQKEVNEGRFREDLYYRMNVVQIRMPPLRERREDVALLVQYFLDVFKEERGSKELKISEKCMQNLFRYDWPGNIRELKNALERAVVMANGNTIQSEDMPVFDTRTAYRGLEVGLTLNEAVNRFKKEFIVANLRHTGGNRTKAAKKMDIQRTYLSRLISKLDITEE